MIIKNFVTIEGLDGAGTTTQLDLIAKHFDAMRTFEPTDGEIGKLIRRVLKKEFRTTSSSLALLYAADRHNHIYGENGIIENAEKRLVVSDRYFYSSFAYQCLSVEKDFVKKINDYPHSQYVIFIDPPVSECMRRINARGEEKELFEKEATLKKVRENYLEIFSSLPEDVKYLHIEGILTIEETFERIKDFLTL